MLREIASVPRPTGSDAIAVARERCARELRALGYDVIEQPFEFSEFVGRYAVPLLGATAAVIAGIAGSLAVRGARIIPLLVVVGGAVALYLASRWLVTRGVLTAPILRKRGINLEAKRGGAEPAIWLCAHLDTKSQPVPTLVRTIGIVLESIGLLMTAILTLAVALGVMPSPVLWGVGALVTLVGAIPVVLCVVGSRSPGALDNASGVVTVLAAARQMQSDTRVGVLITDAEELALAGARAWVAKRDRRGATVLNCDGVDDVGAIHVMFSGPRPHAVIDAVDRGARTCGVAQRPSRMALGILTDSVAFTAARIPSVTFSRGSLWSLARVHSRRDDLAHLRGTGIADTATLMSAAARALTMAGPG